MATQKPELAEETVIVIMSVIDIQYLTIVYFFTFRTTQKL